MNTGVTVYFAVKEIFSYNVHSGVGIWAVGTLSKTRLTLKCFFGTTNLHRGEPLLGEANGYLGSVQT